MQAISIFYKERLLCPETWQKPHGYFSPILLTLEEEKALSVTQPSRKALMQTASLALNFLPAVLLR